MLVATESRTELPALGGVGILRLVLGAAGLRDHLAPHVDEESEGDPVVISGDEAGDGASRKPAEQRHEELKQTEMECQAECRPYGIFSLNDPDADGYGKSVHAECHGHDQDG